MKHVCVCAVAARSHQKNDRQTRLDGSTATAAQLLLEKWVEQAVSASRADCSKATAAELLLNSYPEQAANTSTSKTVVV